MSARSALVLAVGLYAVLPYPGLVQRIGFAIAMSWFVAAAVLLRRQGHGGG